MTLTPATTPASLPAPAAPYIVRRFDTHAEAHTATEWLLTNGMGGFAMGTASGIPRRSYHALLVASVLPPVERLATLVSLDEIVLMRGPGAHLQHYELANWRLTDGSVMPGGHSHLVRFEKTTSSATWVYVLGDIELRKTLSLSRGRNSCAVHYAFNRALHGAQIIVTPRVALRDFHEPEQSPPFRSFTSVREDRSFCVSRGGHALAITADAGQAVASSCMFPEVQLDLESERHLHDMQSLYSPGWFLFDLDGASSRTQFTIAAALAPDAPDLSAQSDRKAHLAGIHHTFHTHTPAFVSGALDPLVDAADDFIVNRVVDGRQMKTIIAGYPWFADWGRDAMIALPGLLLTTGRIDDARSCLELFASNVSEGMIPNRFDDYGDPPHYNTVDASLWFIHTCVEFLNVSADQMTFDAHLKPACMEIIERYQSGTRYGIGMDQRDGLIFAGDESTQLTWMDARRDGVVFTPRHGKAVEINALWHHALCALAGALGDSDANTASALERLALRVKESFANQFWNESTHCLHDTLSPVVGDAQQSVELCGGWEANAQIRPNQIFAVSLKHSPLPIERRRAVLACVRDKLLTPYGLRTLDPADPEYQRRYEGDMTARDRAYHNGTVWPWLIGPYCEAVLRAGSFDEQSKAEVRSALRPLLESLQMGCLGQIAEVYDAEQPQRAQGCIAQAWSVAEVLRVAALVYDDESVGA